LITRRGIGAEIEAPLSADDGAYLRVRMILPRAHRTYARRQMALRAEELARVASERKAYAHAPEHPVHLESYCSEAYEAAVSDLARVVLADVLVGVRGVTVGDADLTTIADVHRLIDLLDEADLLAASGLAALAALVPGEGEKKS